jgi:catechol 2,3-dioxygenase-like lactoylglutathione lyase family enzyme
MPMHKFSKLLFLGIFCITAAWAQTPALIGIAHVAFRVGDLQQSREFYSKLGFEQAFEFADPGKAEVAFIKINDHQFIELYARNSDSQPVGLMHICFEASDIEVVRNEYLKRGLKSEEAKKARAGNLLFIMHDPEGQLLEYTQYMPGSLHFEDRGRHLSNNRIAERLVRADINARDTVAELAFYRDKLGLLPNKKEKNLLGIPGSPDLVGLQAQSANTTSSIAFAVSDAGQVAKDLRKRGYHVRKDHRGVSITDPDGVVIFFTSQYNKRT